jgi:hypothetical protein
MSKLPKELSKPFLKKEHEFGKSVLSFLAQDKIFNDFVENWLDKTSNEKKEFSKYIVNLFNENYDEVERKYTLEFCNLPKGDNYRTLGQHNFELSKIRLDNDFRLYHNPFKLISTIIHEQLGHGRQLSEISDNLNDRYLLAKNILNYKSFEKNGHKAYIEQPIEVHSTTVEEGFISAVKCTSKYNSLYDKYERIEQQRIADIIDNKPITGNFESPFVNSPTPELLFQGISHCKTIYTGLNS